MPILEARASRPAFVKTFVAVVDRNVISLILPLLQVRIFVGSFGNQK